MVFSMSSMDRRRVSLGVVTFISSVFVCECLRVSVCMCECV